MGLAIAGDRGSDPKRGSYAILPSQIEQDFPPRSPMMKNKIALTVVCVACCALHGRAMAEDAPVTDKLSAPAIEHAWGRQMPSMARTSALLTVRPDDEQAVDPAVKSTPAAPEVRKRSHKPRTQRIYYTVNGHLYWHGPGRPKRFGTGGLY